MEGFGGIGTVCDEAMEALPGIGAVVDMVTLDMPLVPGSMQVAAVVAAVAAASLAATAAVVATA